jgi:dihydrodipicolinate synthase/N-acetylneuraminate lyase
MAISRKEAREKLRGPVLPLMTPFKADYELDLEGLRQNVRYLLQKGFGQDGGSFLAVGAAGEFQVMTTEERKRAAEAIVQEVKGRVPIVLGGAHTDTRRVTEIAKFAAKMGIEAVQINPPYYDHGQTVDDVIRFYKLINDSTDVGIMVYTSYWQGHTFPPEFFDRLLSLEHVVAIKFAEPSVLEFRQILRKYADKFAFIDNMGQHIMGSLLGEVGFICHEAHFHLEHELALWKSIQKRDWTKAIELLAKLNWPFYEFLYTMKKKTTIVDTAPTKAAVEMVGLAAGPLRPPARSLTSEERAQLKEILVKAEVPVVRS